MDTNEAFNHCPPGTWTTSVSLTPCQLRETHERAELTLRVWPTHSLCAAHRRRTSRRWLHMRANLRRIVQGRLSRSVTVRLLATRTALLSGVDVCLDLRKCSVGVGLAYRLATRSRNDRPQRTRFRPV